MSAYIVLVLMGRFYFNFRAVFYWVTVYPFRPALPWNQ